MAEDVTSGIVRGLTNALELRQVVGGCQGARTIASEVNNALVSQAAELLGSRELAEKRLEFKRQYEGRRIWWKGAEQKWATQNWPRAKDAPRVYDKVGILERVDVDLKNAFVQTSPKEYSKVPIEGTDFETYEQRLGRFVAETKERINHHEREEERFVKLADKQKNTLTGLRTKLERLTQQLENTDRRVRRPPCVPRVEQGRRPPKKS